MRQHMVISPTTKTTLLIGLKIAHKHTQCVYKTTIDNQHSVRTERKWEEICISKQNG